jgi:hypothetical protein
MSAHEVERAFADLNARADRALELLASLPLIAPLKGNPGLLERTDPHAIEMNAPVWLSFVSLPLDARGLLRVSGETNDVLNKAAWSCLEAQPLSPDAHGLTSERVVSGAIRSRLRIYYPGVIEYGEAGDRSPNNAPPRPRSLRETVCQWNTQHIAIATRISQASTCRPYRIGHQFIVAASASHFRSHPAAIAGGAGRGFGLAMR